MLILQPLSSFSAIKGPGDPAYISASMLEHGAVKIIMRSADDGSPFAGQRAEIEMTREQFIAWCRDGIKAAERAL